MPAALAIPLITAGVTTAASIYGAHKQGESSKDANATTRASNQAAIDEQKRQDALTQANFEKTQAAQQAQWDAEQNIRAPYRQAGQSALSSLGDILGVSFGGGGGSSAAAPSSAGNPALLPKSGEVNWTAPPDQLGSQLSAYFKSRGVSDSEVPYWVSKAPELVARGQQLNDPNYADKWLPRAEVFGSGASSTGTVRRSPNTIAPPPIAPTGNPNALAPNYAPVVPFSSMVGR